MATLKANFDKKVMAILTKDQQATYQKKATKDCCSTKTVKLAFRGEWGATTMFTYT